MHLHYEVRLRPFTGIHCCVVVLLLQLACLQVSEDMTGSFVREAAGPGEEPFSVPYPTASALPMRESEFLAEVEALGLRYEVYADENRGDRLPPPRHTPSADLPQCTRVLQVYGKKDPGVVARIYRAFVDSNGRVVYIENAFAYPAP